MGAHLTTTAETAPGIALPFAPAGVPPAAIPVCGASLPPGPQAALAAAPDFMVSASAV